MAKRQTKQMQVDDSHHINLTKAQQPIQIICNFIIDFDLSRKINLIALELIS